MTFDEWWKETKMWVAHCIPKTVARIVFDAGQRNREKIKLTNKHYNVTEEIYDEFYFCPKCKYRWVLSEFNFCPECGVELDTTEIPD